MQTQNSLKLAWPSSNALGLTGAAFLLPAVLFIFSFWLKTVGIEFPLRLFYRFDQLLFDMGDFLIAVCLPFCVAVVSVSAIKLRKEKSKLLIFTAIASLFLLAVVATVYAITDPIFEARGESVYGF